MEIQAGLHILSVFHDTKGIDETKAGPGHSNRHHIVLAKEVVVFSTLTDEWRAILETCPTTEPGFSGDTALPRPEEIQPDVDQSLLVSKWLSEVILMTL